MTNETDALRRQVATLQERCQRAERDAKANTDAIYAALEAINAPEAEPNGVMLGFRTADCIRRLQAERDTAVASLAALFHAYIGITPGVDVPGLHRDVRARAEALLAVVEAAGEWDRADGTPDFPAAEEALIAAVAALAAAS